MVIKCNHKKIKIQKPKARNFNFDMKGEKAEDQTLSPLLCVFGKQRVEAGTGQVGDDEYLIVIGFERCGIVKL